MRTLYALTELPVINGEFFAKGGNIIMHYTPGHKYRLIEEVPDRTGWCSDCNSQVKIVDRWYVDMQSGSIGPWKVRGACNCMKEGNDPFKANIAPPLPIRPSEK